MKKTKPYLQAAALVSSVLLVGAFIGCQTGAFQPFAKPEPPPEAPQWVTTPEPTPNPPASEGKPTFMPGSKSLMIGLQTNGTETPNPPGARPPTPPPAPTQQQFIIMGGPKSAPVFTPTPANQPNTPPQP
jgi:hypothetical protein